MAKLKACTFQAYCQLFDITLPGRPMTGGRCLVCILSPLLSLNSFSRTETMTEHRTKILSALLPIALATGYTEVEHGFEPLKVRLLSNPNQSS
jgi:hypothetical protein